jgi:hypothetical protein
MFSQHKLEFTFAVFWKGKNICSLGHNPSTLRTKQIANHVPKQSGFDPFNQVLYGGTYMSPTRTRKLIVKYTLKESRNSQKEKKILLLYFMIFKIKFWLDLCFSALNIFYNSNNNNFEFIF